MEALKPKRRYRFVICALLLVMVLLPRSEARAFSISIPTDQIAGVAESTGAFFCDSIGFLLMPLGFCEDNAVPIAADPLSPEPDTSSAPEPQPASNDGDPAPPPSAAAPSPATTTVIRETPTYVTNEYITNPTTVIREVVKETVRSGGGGSSRIDTSEFVTRELLTKQAEVIFDSQSDDMADIAEAFDTGLLTVTGNATIGGTLGVTGAVTSSAYISATDASATSTFSGALTIGTTTSRDTLTVGGPIYLADTTPANTASRLYNQGGSLYWAGNAIAGATVGTWDASSGNVYRQTGNVGIGTSTPNALLTIDGGNINLSDDAFAYQIGGNDFAWASSTATVLGLDAANNASSFSEVTIIGNRAGIAIDDATHFTAVGSLAGASSTGSQVTTIGAWAGREQNSPSGGSTMVGFAAGYLNSNSFISVLGRSAGQQNAGASLTAMGYYAGRENTGSEVTAIGRGAAHVNTGSRVSAFGKSAGQSNSGENGTFLGYYAGHQNSGNDVVAIGYQAGDGNSLDNQFIVQQSNVNATPLIQGDFSTGNVGIGTTTPSSKLTVAGDIFATGDLTVSGLTATTSVSAPYLTATDASATSSFAGGLNVGSGGLVYSHSSGNVGIGKVSPQYPLVIETNSTPSNGVGTGLSFGITSTYQWVQSYSSDPLVLNPLANNIGIRTTNPLAQLHIGLIADKSSPVTYTASASDEGFLTNSYNNTGDGNRRYTDFVSLGNQNGAVGGGVFRFLVNPADSFTAVERLRIDRNGNVGIGSTSPSAKLDVAGDSEFNGTINTVNNWISGDGDSEGISIDDAGNVGIGTTSPNANVHVVDSEPSVLTLESSDTTVGTNQLIGAITFVGNDAGNSQISGIRAEATAPNGNQRLEFHANTYDSGDPSMTLGPFGRISMGTTSLSALLSLQGLTNDGSSNVLHWYDSDGASLGIIDTNGNVGIGTTDPRNFLHVHGTKNTAPGALGSQVIIEDDTAFDSNPVAGIAFRNKYLSNGTIAYMGGITVGKENTIEGDRSGYIGFFTGSASSNPTEKLRITSTGNIGIGTSNPDQALDVIGTIQASNLLGGAVNLTTDANGNIIRDPSDERLKTNVTEIEGALEKVLGLRGVSYEWRDTARFGDQEEIGFVAQEVDLILPEVVRKGGEYWSLNTRNMLAVVVEAIQEMWKRTEAYFARTEELEREAESLRGETDELQEEVASLRTEIEALKSGEEPEPSSNDTSEEPEPESDTTDSEPAATTTDPDTDEPAASTTAATSTDPDRDETDQPESDDTGATTEDAASADSETEVESADDDSADASPDPAETDEDTEPPAPEPEAEDTSNAAAEPDTAEEQAEMELAA